MPAGMAAFQNQLNFSVQPIQQPAASKSSVAAPAAPLRQQVCPYPYHHSGAVLLAVQSHRKRRTYDPALCWKGSNSVLQVARQIVC